MLLAARVQQDPLHEYCHPGQAEVHCRNMMYFTHLDVQHCLWVGRRGGGGLSLHYVQELQQLSLSSPHCSALHPLPPLLQLEELALCWLCSTARVTSGKSFTRQCADLTTQWGLSEAIPPCQRTLAICEVWKFPRAVKVSDASHGATTVA